jgi:hypothetical protein
MKSTESATVLVWGGFAVDCKKEAPIIAVRRARLGGFEGREGDLFRLYAGPP